MNNYLNKMKIFIKDHIYYFLIFCYLPFMYISIGQFNLIYQKNRIINTSFAIDKQIPFTPFFSWIYMIYFIMMIMPLFYNKKLQLLIAKRVFAISTIGHILFFLIPTTVLRIPRIDLINCNSQLLELIYKYDHNVNCFPTLHAAHVFIISFSFYAYRKNIFHISLILTAFMIALSTIIIRQHSTVDVIAALIFSLMIFYSIPLRKKLNIGVRQV